MKRASRPYRPFAIWKQSCSKLLFLVLWTGWSFDQSIIDSLSDFGLGWRIKGCTLGRNFFQLSSSSSRLSCKIGGFGSGGGGIRTLDTPFRGIPGEAFETVPECSRLPPLRCLPKLNSRISRPIAFEGV